VDEKENQILKKIKILLLLVAAFVCVNCSGCADRKQETEQGELVRNETVGEIWQSFFFRRLYV
jgi:hypothetical protein